MVFLESMEKEIPGDSHILGAVFCQLFHLTLFEPLKGLQAVCGFSFLQRFAGQMVQPDAETKAPVDIFQDIKGVQFTEIPVCIGLEDPIVKPFDIKAHHEVRLFEVGKKIIHLILGETEEAVLKTVKEDSHGDAHKVRIVPAAHLLGRLLGLQVKIDDSGRKGLRFGFFLFYWQRFQGHFLLPR